MIRRHMPRQPNELWQPIFIALMCRRREVRGKGYARVQLNKADFARITIDDGVNMPSAAWKNIRPIKFPTSDGDWDHITHVVFYQAGKRIGPQLDQPLPFKKPRATDIVVFPADSLTLTPEAFLNHEHTRP